MIYDFGSCRAIIDETIKKEGKKTHTFFDVSVYVGDTESGTFSIGYACSRDKNAALRRAYKNAIS